ncbi:type II secretion system protein GspM [Paraburkholderia humisilvae]|uniref:Type II secretion system protein M n=1 Tax=Paraburkholderia humisilvae TaxID=627669 RepID=A0A6J5D7Z7_9BURK|nr:type II secretion system protein M [Paraburkholderia humisilvae]CAB3749212.1 Type II secretion system protein M [Paraburkholderia humisilvae]
MVNQIRAALIPLKSWFDARPPRERKLLLAGGAVAAAALVYNALWEPAFEGRAQIAASLPQLEAQLADIRMQVDEARHLKAAAAQRAPTGAALRDALDASLAQTGIANAQLTVLGKGVQIDAKAVPFATWMTWLDQVRKEDHVRAINLRASAEDKPGLVTISATLQPTLEH